MTPILIAELPKNRRETLRISLDEYQGHQLLSLRIWYRDDAGELRPGNKGLAVRVDQAPALADAMLAAVEKAKEEGRLA